MSTPKVLLPTISCNETITSLGLAVSCEHCYWNVYTIVDYQASAFVLDTCLNGEKFGNDDDNDNDNCFIMKMIIRHFFPA